MVILRIGGLASGLDTDTIIKDLMKAHRVPYNKLLQQKQLLQWQRDAYREMNLKITDYRNNKLSNYRLESAWLAKKADVTNDAYVSAKATGAAANGTITVQVNSLATAASNASAGQITTDTSAFNPTQRLGDQNSLLGNKLQQSGGKYITYTFRINGTLITVDPNVDSLDSVIKRINETTNVSAFYDPYTGKVSFVAKQTGFVNGPDGTGDKITFEDVDGDFLSNILLVNEGSGTAATQADVVINGLNTKRDSNTFTVNGVEITLKAPSGGAVSQIAVSTDADRIVETVKNFINDYNDILKTIQDKLDETRYRDYPPLTEEQKKEMDDREIELWEEKAKSGLLRNDDILAKAASYLRSVSYSSVDTGNAKYKTLSSIGIVTGTYIEKGKLYLDENKLREAIAEDPDIVRKLFANPGTAADRSDVGLAKRLYDDLKHTLDAIGDKAGYASASDSTAKDGSIIGEQLYRLNGQIDDWERRMKEWEDRYYRQFTALEMAINRYNAQAAYLANAFGYGSQQ